MKKKLLTSILMLAALLFAGNAFAGSATDFVQTKQTKVFEIIAQPKSGARDAKLKGMFDEIFAYDILARQSLGKEEWGKRSADEKRRFTELLTRLVRNNYRRNLENMLNYDISYTNEANKGSTTMVYTVAKHKNDSREPDVAIDFRTMKINGAWRVVDLVTEQASLVKTYRSQFLRIIKKSGFEALIQKMESKLAKEGG